MPIDQVKMSRNPAASTSSGSGSGSAGSQSPIAPPTTSTVRREGRAVADALPGARDNPSVLATSNLVLPEGRYLVGIDRREVFDDDDVLVIIFREPVGGSLRRLVLLPQNGEGRAGAKLGERRCRISAKDVVKEHLFRVLFGGVV